MNPPSQTTQTPEISVINKYTKILVVDDYRSMRKVTEDQLRKMGAQIIYMAGNGAEALKILESHPVDIVLTDWNMPVMNGLELLKVIRSSDKFYHLPVMMITAESGRDQIISAIESGVSTLLVKPYTMIALSEHLVKTLAWKPNPKRIKLGSDKPQPPAIDLQMARKKIERPSVLVVDDVPDNLHLLGDLLKAEFSIRIAHNGETALKICQSNDPPDLVLLDIMMPGIDGFEVAKRMRDHPTSEFIPVIFVTAMTGDSAHMTGLELGAVDFVTKPIDPNGLKMRVRNFMRYVKLHKQLQAEYDAMLATAKLKEDIEHITRHDIKAPLAGIIGLIQTLTEDTTLGIKQSEQVKMIEETALQAMNMINLSSELFKIETGRFKLDPQPVKIGEILRRIVDVSRTIFSVKQLIISVEIDVFVGDQPPEVWGDAMLCYSLFQNLIKNACEAAPEKSRVTIKLCNQSPIAVVIENHGAVPIAIRDSFFKKFVTYGKTGGTGLGTYSAKLLAEAQNGTISLKVSDQRNLTTLEVNLPRYPIRENE